MGAELLSSGRAASTAHAWRSREERAKEKESQRAKEKEKQKEKQKEKKAA